MKAPADRIKEIGKLGVRQHFLSFLKKTSAPDIHIFWQNPDLPNPQNPHPICALHELN
jgi:hypothetical protein